MEFVQTVLVQIAPDRIDEASRPGGLLPALDEHRSYLAQQPGFLNMRITRSINPEGNILLVIDTRWQDDRSLIEYETREPNVAGIVNEHAALIVRDSLQVLDMEAVRAEAGPESPAEELSRRLVLPLMVPVGALAFALLVIYGLSRVYLELSNAVATGLAAGIAIGILLISWYVATHPRMPVWQLGSLGLVVAAVLAGGAIFAVVEEDEGEAEEPPAAASPTPAADGTPTDGEPPANLFEIAMIPTILFDTDTMTLPADTEVTVSADNQDTAIPHNWAMYESREVAESDGPSAALAITDICNGPCLEEVTFTTPAAGEYFFRCDIHPIQMVGTVTVE